MNIDYTKDNYWFIARATAIILNKDKTKVLLFKVEDGRDYFLLPGGRIELNEDSKSAIAREIFEETGYQLEFNINSIHESFATKDGKKITQYNFCYNATFNDEITEEKFNCKDSEGQVFYWINISELDNYRVYPESIKELINNTELKHIIDRVEE